MHAIGEVGPQLPAGSCGHIYVFRTECLRLPEGTSASEMLLLSGDHATVAAAAAAAVVTVDGNSDGREEWPFNQSRIRFLVLSGGSREEMPRFRSLLN